MKFYSGGLDFFKHELGREVLSSGLDHWSQIEYFDYRLDVIMFQLWHIMNFYTGAFLDFYTGDKLTLNRQSLVSFDYFK